MPGAVTAVPDHGGTGRSSSAGLLQLAFLRAVPTTSLNQEWASVGTNFSGDTDVLAQYGPLAAIGGVLGASRLAVLLYVDAV
ncbi:MAG: hypothetical protein QOF00_5950, partial [Pseudonocardiales bacterium]|nr:hypothetical protein [Pseudonocardiales bacterium]